MGALIECIPNFSEGRNVATVAALADVIQRASGLALLDCHSDADHNRSVLTFAGLPDAVADAAFQLVKKGAALIDLRQHHGVHPRIGATDVIPFVPLQLVTMDDCAVLAKTVGLRIAEELGIPVFLYEHAVITSPRALEEIRKGSLEGLSSRMQTDPKWTPDFGAPDPHPTAGVTAIGARHLLVAFNVNLDSDDLNIAKNIARNIRASSGSLKHVKAIGVRLERRGCVQVSMNLTNVAVTPLHRVFHAVRAEANQCGVDIAGSQNRWPCSRGNDCTSRRDRTPA